MGNKLDELYSPKKFKEFGTDLINLIAEHLEDSYDKKIKVTEWIPPQEQLEFWKNYTTDGSPQQMFKDIITHSINLHHPQYIEHQISPTAPMSSLAGLLSAVLNNGMAVYEMGAASTAIEKIVMDKIAEKIGYDSTADGFITSGGSLANLTALLAAKQSIVDVHVPMNKLAVLLSSEAHYCMEKSLRIMGLDEAGIIQIPVNDQFNMQTDLLETYYNDAVSKDFTVFAVVGSAPSTSTGMHDDLQKIATFCQQKKIWFHVDAAHGGGAIFSNKYKLLLNGIEHADSVTIDGHKMLLMPSIMSFLVFKDKQNSYLAFRQKAVYLWEQANEEDWYDLAKRTFECTKSMMSIQFYVILKFYGEEVFDQFVTRLYDLSKIFSERIVTLKNFELLLQPQSNIVCFRYIKYGADNTELNQLNKNIRAVLLQNGNYYIVQTTLKNKTYLRVTFMNPKTDKKVMYELLDEIQRIAMLFDIK